MYKSNYKGEMDMKLYICTDLEGASGVTGGWTEISPGKRLHEFAKRMLTADVNACIEGAFEAGVSDIVVHDSHGAAMSINIEDLHPDAELTSGRCLGHLPTIDSSFDAMIIIGMHAMEGVRDGLMNGTWAGDLRVWLNDKEVGELGLWAAIAAQNGVPTIMVTGDDATEREAKDLIPGVYTVSVKKGLNRFGAQLIHPTKARLKIKETTIEAIKNYKKVGMYKPETPVELKIDYFGNTQLVDWVAVRPGVKRVNGSTVSYTSNSVKEAENALFYVTPWNMGE